ncbi:hypothetical protein BH24ACI3_BH24ACI3_11010 [soil metagenome]
MSKPTRKANDGKICISICAQTTDELAGRLRQADSHGEVIEVRFDCLEKNDLAATLQLISSLSLRSGLLATARPNSEEFFSNKSAAETFEMNAAFEERISFWQQVLEANLFQYVDFEDDLVFALTYNELFSPELLSSVEIIGSHHNFYETPDLSPVLEIFVPDPASNFRCEIVKVATTAHTITDTIEQWYLLDWAKHFGVKAVPVSMGEVGKWTRILGLAHGAAMTYAALDKGGETASGQITATDLIDIYRVRELDMETEVYGLIAGNTSYSMSPYIHNASFTASKMNRVFVPLQVADLDEFIRRMVRPETREVELNFKGFSVTNPHKQDIIHRLDEIDVIAKTIGAVNTVKAEDGRLIGTNTDAGGFIEPLKRSYEDLAGAAVAVFGSGGAARACIFARMQEGADVTVYARDPKRLASLTEQFSVRSQLIADSVELTAEILVNATPLGTKGDHENETIAERSQLKGVKLVYDLTYNPADTKLLSEAKAAGCQTLGGLDMLIGQAVKQFEYWTGESPSLEAMTAAAIDRLKR